jgi:hypothetical protein
MWTAHLFQVTTGQIGPRLNFESVSWSIELNGVESISMKLRKSDLPTGINLNYWLAPTWAGVVLFFKGVPVVAGPILTRPSESFDTVSIGCGGIRSILAKRLVTQELSDWSGLNKSVVSFSGLSLGTIAKRVVQQVMTKQAGSLPISFPVPDQTVVNDANHERNYRGFNVQNINAHDILTKLSNVIDGPDIMFKPRLLRDNVLTFDMWTGTETQPRIYQRFTPVWDTTPARGQVVDMSTITTGSYQTNRTFSIGAGQDEGLLMKVNTNRAPLQQQFPLLETVVNVGNSENATLVNSYGLGALVANSYPLLEVQMTVRADGEIPLGYFWPGDLVEVVTQGWLSLPDGTTQMRLLSITGDDSNSVKLSLQKEDKFV